MKRLVPALALLLMAACREKPLPVFGQVPDFVLTAQTGEQFNGSSLKGQVWVADFIFTNCPGPCPRMSSQMRVIQNEVAKLGPVKLVSFTVDPRNDTPEVLAAYAKRFQAEPGRWYFLTGPQPTLHMLSRGAFKLSDVDGSLDHSTRFVLVDKRGRIRGYYETSEGNDWRQVITDARRLLEEAS
jgi:protein SCO1